jgi:seryl-tRNA synthetase
VLDPKIIRENPDIVKAALIKRLEFDEEDKNKLKEAFSKRSNFAIDETVFLELAQQNLFDSDTDIFESLRRPEVMEALIANLSEVRVEKLETFFELDLKRRNGLKEAEDLRNKKNITSKEIGRLKSSGKNPDPAVFKEMKEISVRIKEIEGELKEITVELEQLLLSIPNIPHSTTPIGGSEEFNQVVSKWGTPRDFDFQPLDHREVGERLNILDFDRAAKITGSRFALYRGAGALMERALINFMLDVHTREHGYTEVFPPFLANRDSMTGTGQLPKLEDDMFKTSMNYFLIPTGEVPITNMYRDEILPPGSLPLYFVGYTPCFRLEAGAYGQDTRGLIRQHQFNKVEMVKFVEPETSYDELERLLKNAETILQKLDIPYQVVSLCSGDISFAAAKCYDIELWVPSQDRYREVSSCSCFGDFQARRANIKFRREKGVKSEYLHTLNGSGLSVGRTVVAILENNQQEDGTVIVPEALRSYMHGLEIIA